jgi:hypothetical protein
MSTHIPCIVHQTEGLFTVSAGRGIGKSFLSPRGMKAAGNTKYTIKIKIVPIGAIFIFKKTNNK